MSRFLVFCFATVIIRRARERTGKQVAVIIDEYDAPLLDVLHAQPTLDAIRKVMQEFYVPQATLRRLPFHSGRSPCITARVLWVLLNNTLGFYDCNNRAGINPASTMGMASI